MGLFLFVPFDTFTGVVCGPGNGLVYWATGWIAAWLSVGTADSLNNGASVGSPQ